MTPPTGTPKLSVSSLTRAGSVAGMLNSGSVVPRPARRWATRIALPGVIALGAVGLLLYSGRETFRPEVEVEVAPVVLTAGEVGVPEAARSGGAARGEGDVAAQAPGWIEPDPYAVDVSALANGVVRELLVLEGQRVEAGQVVARLVDDDARLELSRAEADVKQKMAEMVVAEAEVKHAKMMWDNPTEQTRAAAVADAELEEARGELARLPLLVAAETARAEEIKDELKRKEPLVGTNAISEGEVAQLRSRLKAQEAALDAVRAMKPVLEARVGAKTAESTAANEALRLRIHDTRELTQAYAAVEVKRAEMAMAEAKRDEARLRVERMDVRSPVAGVVMNRLAEPGSKVMMEMDDPASAWVARVYDPAHLQARVDVPLVDAAKVGVGQRAEVTVDALPGRVFRGEVTRLVHEANIQKNTVQVKVVLKDPAPELRPEMLARVKIYSSSAAPASEGATEPRAGSRDAGAALLAPARVLTTSGGVPAPGSMARVWVVDVGRRCAAQRDVVIGDRRERRPDGEEWLEIARGLRPGDRVIAGDTSRLREGTRVRIVADVRGGTGHGVH